MTEPLPSWPDRPREVANLLNPAFTSLILSRSVSAYETATAQGLPLALSFLILPIVLHPGTRAALPRAATTTMYGWLAENSYLKALFPARAQSSMPFVQEGIRFGVIYEKLRIQEAALRSGSKKFSQSAVPQDATQDVLDCLQKAAFLGRWFAATGSPATILASWGVRP